MQARLPPRWIGSERIGSDGRHGRVQLCRGQYESPTAPTVWAFCSFGGKAMNGKKVSPNSAEIVAQLDASRRGQGANLPSIPIRFGCLTLLISAVIKLRVHVEASATDVAQLEEGVRKGRPLPPFPRDASRHPPKCTRISELHMIINSFEAARSLNTTTLIGPFCF